MAGLERFQERIGHCFETFALLERALTHKSVGGRNNERLEFLGDAVLGAVVSERLFALHPGADEQQLTLMRVSLVRKETLAELGRELGIGAALRLGSGELKSGGRDRDSIIADAVEAVIGAVTIDASYAHAAAVIDTLFATRLSAVDVAAGKDPKTRLQEWVQAQGLPLPDYTIVATEGTEHAKTYVVRCRVASLETTGQASSRREAEKLAATMALDSVAEHG